MLAWFEYPTKKRKPGPKNGWNSWPKRCANSNTKEQGLWKDKIDGNCPEDIIWMQWLTKNSPFHLSSHLIFHPTASSLACFWFLTCHDHVTVCRWVRFSLSSSFLGFVFIVFGFPRWSSILFKSCWWRQRLFLHLNMEQGKNFPPMSPYPSSVFVEEFVFKLFAIFFIDPSPPTHGCPSLPPHCSLWSSWPLCASPITLFC